MALIHKQEKCSICNNKSSCFTFLDIAELDLAENNRLEVRYNKGEMICKQGSFATHIMFLRKGLVKVYLEGKNKNYILSITPKGNLIGLPSLYGDPVFHYSVVAYEDSEICHIDINVFRKFIHENARFSSEVIKLINENSINNYERFFSMTQKNIPGRFADILLYLSDHIYKTQAFSLSISRKDMAEFSSMSIESLSRVIKDFNENKIIIMKGNYIDIPDKARLIEISMHG